MTSTELKDLILKKIELSPKAEADLSKALKGVEGFIFSEFLKFIESLDTERGQIKDNAFNQRKVLSVEQVLFDILKRSPYSSAIGAYLTNFDEVEQITAQINAGVNNINTYRKVLRDRLSREKKAVVNNVRKTLTQKTSFDQYFSTQLRLMLANSVAIGGRQSDLRQQIDQYVKGNKGTGRIQRYAGQISNDAILQYDGRINQMIKREYELNALRYIGGLVKDSRPQCRRWVGKEIIKESDLPKEVSWARENGTGYGSGLNLTVYNFAQIRGGWNCLHAALWFYYDRPESLELVSSL